jgi:hypothetical protein
VGDGVVAGYLTAAAAEALHSALNLSIQRFLLLMGTISFKSSVSGRSANVKSKVSFTIEHHAINNKYSPHRFTTVGG